MFGLCFGREFVGESVRLESLQGTISRTGRMAHSQHKLRVAARLQLSCCSLRTHVGECVKTLRLMKLKMMNVYYISSVLVHSSLFFQKVISCFWICLPVDGVYVKCW